MEYQLKKNEVLNNVHNLKIFNDQVKTQNSGNINQKKGWISKQS